MNTRDKIILNAKTLFIKNGYAAVSMELIAELSGLSRRTLYRYFESREQLAFLIVIDIMSDFNLFYNDLFNKLSGTGIERLGNFLSDSAAHMQSNLNIMKFLSEFDFTFKDSNPEEPESSVLENFIQVSLESDSMIKTIIKQGIEDGSIDEKTDPDLTAKTISNVLWSFGQRISIRAKHIERETDRDSFELLIHQINLYIKALRSGGKK